MNSSLLAELGVWSFLLSAVLITIAFFIHEFSKVVIANILTDDAVEVGVPIKRFIEPVGFVLMYVYSFGWSNGPKINVSKFKDRKKGAICVYGGAIVTSIVLGMIIMIIASFVSGGFGSAIYELGVLSITVGVMNVIPMYPFSGYNLFFETQSPNTRMWLMNNKVSVQFIALFFVLFGFYRPILNVFVNFFVSIVRLF